MNKRKVLLVIVTYNAMRYLWIEKCLKSVDESNFQPDVFVVDNNSTDNTREYIRSINRKIELIESKYNLGFGKANNLGFEYAIKNNYDFVFLLNQDAYLERDTIEKLLSLNFSGYGIVSPLQCNGNGDGVDEDFIEFLGPRQSPDFLSDGIANNFKNMMYDCQFVMAAAWFMPIDTVKIIGGFSPYFYHYGEDENYCHRVVYHKLKIGIYPKCKIYHDRIKKQEAFFNPVDGPYRHHIIRILNPLLANYRFRSKINILIFFLRAVLLNKSNDKKVFLKLLGFLRNKKSIDENIRMTKSNTENLYLNV